MAAKDADAHIMNVIMKNNNFFIEEIYDCEYYESYPDNGLIVRA